MRFVKEKLSVFSSAWGITCKKYLHLVLPKRIFKGYSLSVIPAVL